MCICVCLYLLYKHSFLVPWFVLSFFLSFPSPRSCLHKQERSLKMASIGQQGSSHFVFLVWANTHTSVHQRAPWGTQSTVKWPFEQGHSHIQTLHYPQGLAKERKGHTKVLIYAQEKKRRDMLVVLTCIRTLYRWTSTYSSSSSVMASSPGHKNPFADRAQIVSMIKHKQRFPTLFFFEKNIHKKISFTSINRTHFAQIALSGLSLLKLSWQHLFVCPCHSFGEFGYQEAIVFPQFAPWWMTLQKCPSCRLNNKNIDVLYLHWCRDSKMPMFKYKCWWRSVLTFTIWTLLYLARRQGKESYCLVLVTRIMPLMCLDQPSLTTQGEDLYTGAGLACQDNEANHNPNWLLLFATHC